MTKADKLADALGNVTREEIPLRVMKPKLKLLPMFALGVTYKRNPSIDGDDYRLLDVLLGPALIEFEWRNGYTRLTPISDRAEAEASIAGAAMSGMAMSMQQTQKMANVASAKSGDTIKLSKARPFAAGPGNLPGY